MQLSQLQLAVVVKRVVVPIVSATSWDALVTKMAPVFAKANAMKQLPSKWGALISLDPVAIGLKR